MRVKAIDGLPVIDAKGPMILTVTKNDTRHGAEKEPSYCAIARAAKREHHALEVRVHLSRAYVRMNNHNWLRFIVPAYVRTEIICFDRGGSFMPGEYRLAPPQPSKRVRKKQSKSTKKGGGKKRQPPHVVHDVRTGPA